MEAVRDYEAEQGHQYREIPVFLDSEIVGPIIATVTRLQWELQVSNSSYKLQ